ncbi:hypothetical protein HOG98_00975 [bacterium]|nr:hypothetical protein [bacterium]
MISFNKKILSSSNSENSFLKTPSASRNNPYTVSNFKKISPTSVAQQQDLYLQHGDTLVKELFGGASGARVYLIKNVTGDLKVRKFKLNSGHGHNSKNVLEEPHWISYVSGNTNNVSPALVESRKISESIYGEMSKFYPKIYALGEIETSDTNFFDVKRAIGVFYDQEYLEGRLAIDGLRQKTISHTTYFQAIAPFIDLLSLSWESEHSSSLSKNEGSNLFNKTYVHRCISRIKSDPRIVLSEPPYSTHSKFNTLLNSQGVTIDNIYCINPFELLSKIKIHQRLTDIFSIEKLIPHFHGDATAQNTMISESGQAKFFDPRADKGWRESEDMLKNDDIFELMKIGFGPYLHCMINNILSFNEVITIDTCKEDNPVLIENSLNYASTFSLDKTHPFLSWLELFVSHLKNSPKFMSTIGSSPNWEIQLKSAVAIQGLADITYRNSETFMINDFLFTSLLLNKVFAELSSGLTSQEGISSCQKNRSKTK